MEPITSIIEEQDEEEDDEMEAIALSTPPVILEPADEHQKSSNPSPSPTKPQSLAQLAASIKLKSRTLTRAVENHFQKRCESPDDSGGTRVYQVWPGNNVFFFHGRLVFGPDPKGLILTTVSIVISCWVSAIDNDNLVTRLCSLVLALIVLLNLLLATAFDPGIIPRSNQPPPCFDEIDSSNITETSGENRVASTDNGAESKPKYCRICRIYRPPRSCHCDVCGNCVEKFDHHCPWIGQCVALRNYRRFVAFIFSALVFFVYVFAITCWRIHGRMMQGFVWIVKNCPEDLALSAFSFAAVCFLGGLAGFHLYLIAVNQTAYENYGGSFKSAKNPYDRGILENVKEALFAQIPSFAVDFRSQVCQESV